MTIVEQQTSKSPVKPLALRALEVMYLTRFMDDKCFKLSRQNKGGTFQLSARQAIRFSPSLAAVGRIDRHDGRSLFSAWMGGTSGDNGRDGMDSTADLCGGLGNR